MVNRSMTHDDTAAARNILSCSFPISIILPLYFRVASSSVLSVLSEVLSQTLRKPLPSSRRKSRNKTSKYTDLVSVLLVYNNVYSINLGYNSTRIYFNLRCDTKITIVMHFLHNIYYYADSNRRSYEKYGKT